MERSHGKPRSTNGSDRGRVQNHGRKLDNSGLCCDELDEITDTEALLINRNEATRIVDTSPEVETEMKTVIVDDNPIVRKQPDVIGAVPIDITDGRVRSKRTDVKYEDENCVETTSRDQPRSRSTYQKQGSGRSTSQYINRH